MPASAIRGASLAELLMAMVLLSGLALASAPVAVRTHDLLARGRALLEAAHLAQSRRTAMDSLPCGSLAAGRDTGSRGQLDWRVEPSGSVHRLTLLVVDVGARWPPDTVEALVPCRP